MKSRIYMDFSPIRIVGKPEIKESSSGEEYLSFKAKFDDDTEIYKMQVYSSAPDYKFAVDANKNILLKKGNVYLFRCLFTQKTEVKKTNEGVLIGYTVNNFYKVERIDLPIPTKEYKKLPKQQKATETFAERNKKSDDILAQFGEVD